MLETLALIAITSSIVILFIAVGSYEYLAEHTFRKIESAWSKERITAFGEMMDVVSKVANFLVIVSLSLMAVSIILVIIYRSV